ncbi:MAG: hypothetical protein KF799_14135 [Bdellovibrionales bacterium]|nr:hypothetical protein [Bdellovibrionales bacterium]
MAMRTLALLILTVLHTGPTLAQEGGYRFQPPPPPPLDGADFDDGDEEIDGDAAYLPPTPPPASGGGNTNGGAGNGGAYSPPPLGNSMPSGGGGGGGFNLTTPHGKFRFKVVEGEFYEKGKKRGRGQGTRVSGESTSPR